MVRIRIGFLSGKSLCIPPFRSGNYTNPYITDSVKIDLGIHHFSSLGEKRSCIAFKRCHRQSQLVRVMVREKVRIYVRVNFSSAVARGRHRKPTLITPSVVKLSDGVIGSTHVST